MEIRSTAKAIAMRDSKILLNKCWDEKNGDYYSLPGGGQHQFETLPDAVVRECLEETGYTVHPVRFAALCEEICMDPQSREKYPGYMHKMYHVFVCTLADAAYKQPTEVDSMQLDSEWVETSALSGVRILPKLVGEHILAILDGTAPVFLGSEHITYPHG